MMKITNIIGIILTIVFMAKSYYFTFSETDYTQMQEMAIMTISSIEMCLIALIFTLGMRLKSDD